MKSSALLQKLRKPPLWALGLVLAGALAAVWFLRSGEAAAVESELAGLQSDADRIQRHLAAARGQPEHLEEMDALLRQVDERLVSAGEQARNLAEFYKLSEGAGVTITSISQLTPSARIGPGGAYLRVPYQVLFSGTYEQALLFLHRIESGSRFFTMTNFTIQGAAAGHVTVNLSFEFLGRP